MSSINVSLNSYMLNSYILKILEHLENRSLLRVFHEEDECNRCNASQPIVNHSLLHTLAISKYIKNVKWSEQSGVWINTFQYALPTRG